MIENTNEVQTENNGFSDSALPVVLTGQESFSEMLSKMRMTIAKSKEIITENATKKKFKEEQLAIYENAKQELMTLSHDIDVLARASTLIGTVADTNTRAALDNISAIINRALALIFKEDPRSVKIEQVLYRNSYPHFVVTLYTGVNKRKRAFKQSGNGLAQLVSFLFDVGLVDIRKGRKFICLDELFNGLHPTAKRIMYDLMIALSSRFQFVITEYNLDTPNQYLVERRGDYSVIVKYPGDCYYADVQASLLEESNRRVSASVSKSALTPQASQ